MYHDGGWDLYFQTDRYNLLLHYNKTELLNITNDPNTYFPDIIINQHKIIPNNAVKYLGVNFNNISLKSAYLLNLRLHSYLILTKIGHYLNKNTTKLLTQTLILSKLKYGNSLFAVSGKLKIEKLDKIINRSFRNIYRLQKTDYTTSITDLRNKLNWLNTEDSQLSTTKYLQYLKRLLLITYPIIYETK